MSARRTAGDWIRELGLQPHPEGGWFREIYRAGETIVRAALASRYGGDRTLSTSIYFLLASGQVSRLHRLKSDEIWHFYEGSPVVIHSFRPDGAYAAVTLGRDASAGQVFQAVIRAGCWFGAEVAAADSFALVGCTIAPGFEFEDFELGRREDLLAAFPAQRGIIEKLA
jgi:predicted cupin superfamily sugar epimerase